MTARFARAEDAPALLSVYAQYIDTPVTFETELPSAAEFRARIEEIIAFYPYLVLQEAGVAVVVLFALPEASFGFGDVRFLDGDVGLRRLYAGVKYVFRAFRVEKGSLGLLDTYLVLTVV